MTNLDAKEAAANKLKNDFLNRFNDGLDTDEDLKIEAYQRCIEHTAQANLTLIAQIQDSIFEPKLFVKKAVEDEKVEQDDRGVVFSMVKRLKKNKSFLSAAKDLVKSAVRGKKD